MENPLLVPRRLIVNDKIGICLVTCSYCGRSMIDKDYPLHLGNCSAIKRLERENEIRRIVREELKKVVKGRKRKN